MSFFSSLSGRTQAWIKLILYSGIAWLILGIVIPWFYEVIPPLRHSRDQQWKYDISAGAIYYTDVPVTLDSEMACRQAVKEAIEKRKAAAK